MRRFTVSQLFMATALIAISLMLWQSEGCGRRYSKIGCLRFSPDGRAIAVARYDARDANQPGKGYVANLSRTVSLMSAEDGSTQWVAESKVKRGNCGPARFEYGRVQADIGIDRERLIVREFGGSTLWTFDYDAKLPAKSLSTTGYNIVAFGGGQFVLAGGPDSTHLLWLTDNQQVWSLPFRHSTFGASPALAVSEKSGLFAAAFTGHVDIGEIATGRILSERRPTAMDNRLLLDVAFALDGRKLVLASYDLILFFDIDSRETRTISREPTNGVIAVSPSGAELAFSSGSGFKVWDLESNRSVFGKGDFKYVTALCFSPDGSRLVVGDVKGRVTCYDTVSWAPVWATSASGHYAPSWVLPAALLAGWFWAARRLILRRNKTKTEDPITSLDEERKSAAAQPGISRKP